jgi:hypothetical protein
MMSDWKWRHLNGCCSVITGLLSLFFAHFTRSVFFLQHYRLMRLLRTQTVTITLTPAAAPALDAAELGPCTQQERKHYRMAWEQRLVRNANRAPEPCVKLHLFGIPTAFAQFLGLSVA